MSIIGLIKDISDHKTSQFEAFPILNLFRVPPLIMDIKTLLDNLHEELSCSVCMTTFTNPKQLPCLHSFCLHCLEGILRTSGRHDVITCPECRRESRVPSSGTWRICRLTFASTVSLMCWPLKSVTLRLSNVATATKRAPRVSTVSSVVHSGAKPTV